MKNLVLAGLFCAAISPAFATPSFAYKVGDLPPRAQMAKEQQNNAQMSVRLRDMPKDDVYALLAVGITLLAYKIRNKRIVPSNKR